VSDPSPATVRDDVPFVDSARRSFLRRRERRRLGVAAASTVVVLVALVVGIATSPGWPAVHEAFFNGAEFKSSFPAILAAFKVNVKMFLICEVFVLILALGIALIRGLKSPVFAPFRLLAIVWVDVFRGVPTILLIFLFGFGIPALQIKGLTSSVLVWGGFALVVSYSAYVAEVYRAGIESIHPSQSSAARSLGLSQPQTLRFVVLPQAIRNSVPPLLNDFISLQKDTALLSVLGPIEALRQAQIDESADFNFTPIVAAALIFICLTIPLTRLADWMLARDRRRQLSGER
jgi:polar amino acid transport system permease protein